MVGDGNVLYHHAIQRLPRGSCGREVPHRRHREASLGQDGPHDPAHLAGSAVQADADVFHSASSLNASCRTDTAFSISSSRTTQVIRMAEVEIISMLIPF